MPSNRETWSSWNYLTRTSRASSPPSTVSLTYNMNILQHIPVSEYGHVLVTLNPLHAPAPALTQGTWTYAHPLYNADAVSAQKQLGRIQNTRGISYCGAWTGYGFHEDGFTSGLRVAVEHLGAEVPFPVIDSKFSRATKPRPGLTHRIIRLVVQVIQGLIVAWLWFNTAVSRRYGKVKNF